MLDRMDMNVTVQRMNYEELYGKTEEECSEVIKQRVLKAQNIQKKRLEPYGVLFNSQIPAKELEQICGLGMKEKQVRKKIFETYQLSARGTAKLLKVARTIADLDESQYVKEKHIWEALSYRMSDFYGGGAGIGR